MTTTAAGLSEYNIILALDTSGSMAEPVKAGSKVSRWDSMQESVMTLVREAEEFDDDGLDMVLFGGNNITSKTGVTSQTVREFFVNAKPPRGGTPLAEGLTEALKLAKSSSKKAVIVVMTDGVPNDEEAAAKVIINAANEQQTDDQLTFLFVQVGDDANATRYLAHLDDTLPAKFDIVDVKTVAEVDKFSSTAELIIAAIVG